MQIKQLEVCAFNIQSSLIAQKIGASRVELCDNPIEGGTTPSFGTIKQVRENISIDLFPIVRPRSGNYYYSADEYQIIKNDIEACRILECNGISIGAQTINGEIDKDWLKRIVDWAGSLKVTCNRAFDGVPDIFKALEDIIECGCERVLTSGGEIGAPQGTEILKKLVEQAGDRIIIMPGAGIKSSNLKQLVDETKATEFHASAREVAVNPLHYINRKINDYGNLYVSSETELQKMIDILRH
ncbi:copper homeostasis protein CutC [Sphingobacterium sp. SRCM116780]|uniref:copper homeostasis protein CutC n=1 Tax=Sphingobacterium sp. SRCM116780 TaxID=2907623 RepID=UPI001F1FEB83|nr:copper homeostasis protein CutC [Sphingobacterium sp. SRCM116780]UIR57522.1 copper homeostasis protein CutC [Sphingobacterium sp. SRCM116780]